MVRTTFAVAGLMGLGLLAAPAAAAAPVSEVSCGDPCLITDPGYFPTAINAWFTLPDQVGAIPGKAISDAGNIPGKVVSDITGLPDKIASDIAGIPGKLGGGSDEE